MPANFPERRLTGDAHTQHVKELLIERAWNVCRRGQEVFGQEMVTALQGTRSTTNHEPDLLAVRGCRVAEIECKTTLSESGRRYVKLDQLDVQRPLAAVRGAILYYVFADLVAVTGDAVLEAVQRAGRRYRVRPGDAVEVPETYGRRFDSVFGDPVPGQLRFSA